MRLAKKPAAATPKPDVNTPASTPKRGVKTPAGVTTTPKEKGKKKGAISLQEGGAQLKQQNVSVVIQALLKQVASKDGDKKELFDQDGQRVNLQITGIKLPKDHRQQLLNIELPFSPLPDPHGICLIVKDLEKGIRPDHEPTVLHYKALLESKGVTGVEVMALRELKVEYKPYEAKTALCHKFDKFLADERIVRLLPKFLGKPFYKRRRFPVPVNLTVEDLKSELRKCAQSVMLPLSHHGSCSMVEVGNTQMKQDHLVKNVLAVSQVLAKRYPGGWKNIRSLHVKTETSLAIPIHVSTASPNDVGFVDADIPRRITKQPVTDELSTQPGMEVTVLPRGVVKITKTKDPDWDDEKDEPFVEDSDEQEEEEEEEEDKEMKKGKKNAKGKKRKTENKLTEDKNKKSRQDSDSEDEKIENVEKEYLLRSLEGEDSNKKPVQEEEEDSEGEEEEESEYDDDEELDAKHIVVDEEDEEESEDDADDDKLLLKRKSKDSSDDDE